MTKSKSILVLSMLLIAIFLPAGTFAEEIPAKPCATMASEAQEEVSVLEWLGVESDWLVVPIAPQTSFTLNCSHWNSSWCTYKWDKFNFCCNPIWIAPGAYCPNICI